MRLVDADTLIRKIIQLPSSGATWLINAEEALKAIDEQPIIDAVPVVRCIDCKYSSLTYDGYLKCCKLKEAYVCEDFYCANGEKEDEID